MPYRYENLKLLQNTIKFTANPQNVKHLPNTFLAKSLVEDISLGSNHRLQTAINLSSLTSVSARGYKLMRHYNDNDKLNPISRYIGRVSVNAQTSVQNAQYSRM